jgi:hypothetical protein
VFGVGAELLVKSLDAEDSSSMSKWRRRRHLEELVRERPDGEVVVVGELEVVVVGELVDDVNVLLVAEAAALLLADAQAVLEAGAFFLHSRNMDFSSSVRGRRPVGVHTLLGAATEGVCMLLTRAVRFLSASSTCSETEGPGAWMVRTLAFGSPRAVTSLPRAYHSFSKEPKACKTVTLLAYRRVEQAVP